MISLHNYIVSHESSTKIVQIEDWSEVDESLSIGYSKVLWVLDKNVGDIPYLNQRLVIVMDGGEDTKSLQTWEWLITRFSDLGLDRNSHIVVVGGGSLSDTIGFAASIYLRGVHFSIVPSTLLSLIDAGMGGKNGLNFKDKKNQIGTIYQPQCIFYLPSLIRQLPIEYITDAFAEIIKYALIMDDSLFEKLSVLDIEQVLSKPELFNEIIHCCIMHKSSIIQEDPFENGKRRILNFGHTLGHAIEPLYSLSHGKSVAIGMYFAAKLSELHYDKKDIFSSRIKHLIHRFNLPTKLSFFSAESVFEKIQSDKKRQDDRIYFVFLEKIGKAKVEKISLQELKRYIQKSAEEKWMF